MSESGDRVYGMTAKFLKSELSKHTGKPYTFSTGFDRFANGYQVIVFERHPDGEHKPPVQIGEAFVPFDQVGNTQEILREKFLHGIS